MDFKAPGDDRCWNASLFREDLEQALKEICPGAELVVDTYSSNGEPSTGHVELDSETLCSSKYCAHRAGCNLLIDLLRKPIQVDEILPNTVIVQSDVDQFWPGTPMKVEWVPPYHLLCSGTEWPWEDCQQPHCQGCYRGPQPLAALLAHELIHAWHHQKGEYCSPSPAGWKEPEEICTVQAENQIRWEMGGPTRCSYGTHCIVFPEPNSDLTWQVSDPGCTGGAHDGKYDCILLDPYKDQANCGCGRYGLSLWSVVKKHAYCWLKAAQSLLLREKPRIPSVPEDWRERSGFDSMYRAYLDPLPDDSKYREMEWLTEFLVARRNELVGEVLEGLFDHSRDAFVLERVTPHGAYTLISYFSTPKGDRFITNLRPPNRGREPPTDNDGRLTDVLLAPDPGRAARSLLSGDRIREMPDRIGGLFGLADGGADFLQVKSGGQVKVMAGRNLRQAVIPDLDEERRDRDPDDSLRWAAVRAILEWGRRTRAEL